MADNISPQNDSNNQSFPDTTAEIAAMLNIDSIKATAVETHSATPGNLPVIDAVSTPVNAGQPSNPADNEAGPEANAEAEDEDAGEVFDPTNIMPPPDIEKSRPLDEIPNNSKAKFWRTAKAAAPYIGIFIVGLFLYQYFFSGFSVANFLKSDESNVVASQSEVNQRLEDLKKEKAVAYNTWIRQFFYEVSDPAIIDMDNDLSGNGLTNFEKFLLNLNPKAYDTLGLGQPDGQTVMDGINPWTGKALSDNQKQIVELYFDRQIISNRLAAGSLKLSQGTIANNNSAPGSSGYQNPGNYSFTDGTGASAPAAAGSNPQVAGAYTNRPNLSLPGTSAAGRSEALSTLDINQSIPGELNIPDNKIKVPLIFTQDTANFEKDLTKGVVHYPGTALPGSAGVAYISGHSSGYAWQKNPYKNIFRSLGSVKDGTSFTITVTLKDGRKATINYVVEGRKIYKANDPDQFLQTADARVALSTCWPIDTSKERLAVFAIQTQVSF
jgi:LPXTG-site transpeptidase (sortase) family protein